MFAFSTYSLSVNVPSVAGYIFETRTCLVHTAPEESDTGAIWNRGNLKPEVSICKRIKCFPSTLRRGKFKNATNTGHFGFVFEENSAREITWLSWRHRFRRASFSKCFPSTRKRKASVFKFFRFEELVREAAFSQRISVDVRTNSYAFKFLQHIVFTVSVKESDLLWWRTLWHCLRHDRPILTCTLP